MTCVRRLFHTASAALAVAAVVSIPSPLGAQRLDAPTEASADQNTAATGACSVSPGGETRVFSGVVADAQGARIPRAAVIVECPPFRQQTQSNSEGAFSLPLPAGRFRLRIESVGFAPFRDIVVVSADRHSELEVTLTVAQLADEVTVRAPSAIATRSAGGTRTDTPLVETPQAISVITKDQIDAQNAQSMQEVLRYSAGVRAEMYGVDNRGDWFALRGGSEGSTLLDGLRLPLSGWWGNVRIEPFTYERIEVLRGPSSVMAGQNGPGGVVNLVSKRPLADPHREVSVQLGAFAQKQLAVDFTGPIDATRTLLYRVVGLVRDSGTQVDHTGDSRQLVSSSLTWRPNRATSLTAFAEYQRDESDNNVGFFPWEGMLLPAPHGQIPVDTFIGEPAWDTYGGNRTRVGYQATRTLTPAWTVSHSVRFDNVNGHLQGMYANFWEGLLDDDRSVNRTWYAHKTDTRIANTDAQAVGTLRLGRTEHTVLVAVDALWSRDVNPGVEGAATSLDVYTPTYGTFSLPPLEFGDSPKTAARQFGLTVQDQVKLGRLVLVGSARRDQATLEVDDSLDAGSDDGAWTHRVGAVYLLDGGFAPYVSQSRSFELVTGVDAHGAPFKPKRGQQVEAGLKWSPTGGAVIVSAAGYTLEEKNRLTADPSDPTNQVQRGEVTVNGVELEASASLRSWDLLSSYTWSDAKLTASSDPADPYLGHRLTSIPEHAASIWGVYKFALQGAGARAGLGVRYVGRTWDGLDQLSVPSNTLVDALVSIDLGRWRYSLNASNLFDKVYLATCLDRGDCWFGSRRKLAGTLSRRW
jgi:iron complex outermembrane receptor protein